MSEFVEKGHSEKIAFRRHKRSDKRYWERFSSCGQPDDPKIKLGTAKISWERFNADDN